MKNWLQKQFSDADRSRLTICVAASAMGFIGFAMAMLGVLFS
jgi:hypothetical protein